MAPIKPEPLFAPVLHSDRLTLTLYDLNNKDDNDFMFKIFNTVLAGEGPTDGNWTVEDIRRLSYSVMLKSTDTGGRLSNAPAIYTAHIGNSTKSPIGVINLCRRTQNVPLDIGFMILPEYRRQGYCIEAATRVLRYWTEEFGIKEICLVTTETNIPARRVADKLNMIDGGWIFSDDSKCVAYILSGMRRLEGPQTSFWGEGEEHSSED